MMKYMQLQLASQVCHKDSKRTVKLLVTLLSSLLEIALNILIAIQSCPESLVGLLSPAGVKGHCGKQVTPHLLNKAFLTKSTYLNSYKVHAESDGTSLSMFRCTRQKLAWQQTCAHTQTHRCTNRLPRVNNFHGIITSYCEIKSLCQGPCSIITLLSIN